MQVSENAAHKLVFKEEATSWDTARKSNVDIPFFNCNNKAEALNLWSVHELGGTCPARQAGYWRKRRGGEKVQRGKGLRQSK